MAERARMIEEIRSHGFEAVEFCGALRVGSFECDAHGGPEWRYESIPATWAAVREWLGGSLPCAEDCGHSACSQHYIDTGERGCVRVAGE